MAESKQGVNRHNVRRNTIFHVIECTDFMGIVNISSFPCKYLIRVNKPEYTNTCIA